MLAALWWKRVGPHSATAGEANHGAQGQPILIAIMCCEPFSLQWTCGMDLMLHWRTVWPVVEMTYPRVLYR